MLDSIDCSALEEVAAFAEGRLRGAERERLIAHLAGCADCREVLAETIEVGADLDAETSDQKVADLRPVAVLRPMRSEWAVRVGAVAATVVVVGSSLVAWQLEARKHPPSRSEWLAEMPPARELAPHIWGGIRMRGAGEAGELSAQSTEIGALLVDLEVALAANDAGSASDVLNRAATILDAAGMMDDDATMLRSAAERDIVATRTVMATQLPELQKRLVERFDDFYLDLGSFAGEARIAVTVGDRDFLTARHTRRYIAWLLTQRDRALSPAALEALRLLSSDTTTAEQRRQAATDLLQSLTS